MIAFKIFDKENKERLSYVDASIRYIVIDADNNTSDITEDVFNDIPLRFRKKSGDAYDEYWITKEQFDDLVYAAQFVEEEDNIGDEVGNYYIFEDYIGREHPLGNKSGKFVVDYMSADMDGFTISCKSWLDAWMFCKDWTSSPSNQRQKAGSYHAFANIYRTEEDAYDDDVDYIAHFEATDFRDWR